MRLTDEKITDIKEYLNRSIKVTASSLIPQLSKYGIDLIDTIEALQQENEQLQAQVARMREALTVANNYMPDIGQFCVCGKCKGCGTDIGYSGYEYCLKCARGIIDAALSDTPSEQLEQQTVDLIAEVDTIEAMQKHIEALQAECARVIIDAALSDTPADVEALQQENEQLRAQAARVREALRKARETISAWDSWFECDRCKNMRDALAAIDKVIGGKEDA